MNKWKNWLLGSGLVTIMLFLSGCVRMDSNGNPDTSGIIYRIWFTQWDKRLHI